MHHRARDIAGLTVGFLTALEYQGSDGRKSMWTAKCVCGAIVSLAASELLKQKAKGIQSSCGCKRAETISKRLTRHGMSKQPAHSVWASMLARCANPNHRAYHNYGGRGIQVCERWLDFVNFWEDMGGTYRPGLTLDRENNDGGYTPGNCRWVGWHVQAQNRRSSVVLPTSRGDMTIAEAAHIAGVGMSTISYRVSHGVTGEELFSPPNSARKFTTSSTAAHAKGS